MISFPRPALLLALLPALSAQSAWIDPTAGWETQGPPKGTLLIHGGSLAEWSADAFLALLGDKQAPIVVLPTAGEDDACGDDAPAARTLRERGAGNVTVLHTRERGTAQNPGFAAPLRTARGVWISGGQQSRLAQAYLHTCVHRELFGVLERGGVVAGNSAGASIQGEFLYGGHAAGDIGFKLVRGTAIGQHYLRRRRQGTLVRILEEHRQLLGIGIDEETYVLVRGDRMQVHGFGKVAFCDPWRPGWPGAEPYELLLPGEAFDLSRREKLGARKWDPADLWEGRDKPWTSPAWAWNGPSSPAGALVLAGDQPGAELLGRFLELAGGPEAPLLYIPTAASRAAGEAQREYLALRALGARELSIWHTIDRNAANSIAFTAPLRQAAGVWFGPGEQWRLAEAYLHTLAHRELFALLGRGGAVGGSGAGARFLGIHMAGDPDGWNEGAGLLRGAALHTWAMEKRPIAAMEAFLAKYSYALGIGIDAGAGIVVAGDRFEVLGPGKAALFDPSRRGWPWGGGDASHILLGAGEEFDLRARRPLW